MTFFTYMMRNHRRKDTAQGDLADDMYEDREEAILRTGMTKSGATLRIAERAGAVWTYSKNAGKPMSKPRKTGGETGQESRISVSMKSIRTGTESFTTRSMDAFGKRREQAGPCTDSAIQQRTRRCRHV